MATLSIWTRQAAGWYDVKRTILTGQHETTWDIRNTVVK